MVYPISYLSLCDPDIIIRHFEFVPESPFSIFLILKLTHDL